MQAAVASFSRLLGHVTARTGFRALFLRCRIELQNPRFLAAPQHGLARRKRDQRALAGLAAEGNRLSIDDGQLAAARKNDALQRASGRDAFAQRVGGIRRPGGIGKSLRRPRGGNHDREEAGDWPWSVLHTLIHALSRLRVKITSLIFSIGYRLASNSA